MFKMIIRLVNRKEIAELQGELEGLELRLPSMKDKLYQSRSTAELWEERVKTVMATEGEKKASVDYYWADVYKDEEEISRMEVRIEEIKERLVLLGL
jgi:chromosome segregation ATPase